MQTPATDEVDHKPTAKRKAQTRGTRVRLTPDLERRLMREIGFGSSLAEAIRRVSADLWRESGRRLNPSSVYRWIERARNGYGSAAEESLRRNIESISRRRGRPVTRDRALLERRVPAEPATISCELCDRLGEEHAELERRVRLLEAAVSELTGGDPLEVTP